MTSSISRSMRIGALIALAGAAHFAQAQSLDMLKGLAGGGSGGASAR